METRRMIHLFSTFFSVKQKKLVMELVEVVQLKSSIKWHSIVCDNEDKVLSLKV